MTDRQWLETPSIFKGTNYHGIEYRLQFDLIVFSFNDHCLFEMNDTNTTFFLYFAVILTALSV